VPVLYEHAVKRNEGKLLQGGTFAVYSGERTGRSPKDKFVVRTPEISEHVWWGNHNQPLSVDTFERLRCLCMAVLGGSRHHSTGRGAGGDALCPRIAAGGDLAQRVLVEPGTGERLFHLRAQWPRVGADQA